MPQSMTWRRFADDVIGTIFIRGLPGGQRKRVEVWEW